MANEQREFWSRVAQKYDAVVDAQIGPRTRSLLRERVAREDRLGRVVEFGCGTGFFTGTLAARADHVLATDLSPGMLALAKERTTAPNVTFQVEDCQRCSLPARAFDTAFMSLVIHFTEPATTVAEMHRVLRPRGTLVVLNLDMNALRGLDRVRALVRIVYRGATGYRLKPPKGFGSNMLGGEQMGELLARCGFDVVARETITDDSRSSHIPVNYLHAVKL